MTLIDITLMVTVITASFFVGIIAAMMSVIQRMLNLLDFATYTEVMQGIITCGRRSPVIWTLLLIPVISASFSLYLLRDAFGECSFLWLVMGLVLFVTGPMLVSRFGNEPYYDQVMDWNPDQIVTDWEPMRQRWFWLNVIRFVVGGLGCVALALAVYT